MFLFLSHIFLLTYKILISYCPSSIVKHHVRRIKNRSVGFIDFSLFIKRQRLVIYLIIILAHAYTTETNAKDSSGSALIEIDIQPISFNSISSHLRELLPSPHWWSRESTFSSLGSQFDSILSIPFENGIWKHDHAQIQYPHNIRELIHHRDFGIFAPYGLHIWYNVFHYIGITSICRIEIQNDTKSMLIMCSIRSLFLCLVLHLSE